MRLLLCDIETAPNLVHAWGLWGQDIGLSQLLESSYVLCWSAKWVGEERVFFGSRQHSTAKQMLKGIHALLSMSDAVISWNGASFDIPILSKEFLEHGFKPPAPFQQIDLMLVAKKKFRFTSNKLEHVVKLLKCGKKIKHAGHELWIGCMAGNRKSWATMKRYNVNDTKLLEAVYNKFLPWITTHPHVGLREGSPDGCPNCGGLKLQSRGYGYTKLGKYERYVCLACGTWTRSGKRAMLAKHNPVAV